MTKDNQPTKRMGMLERRKLEKQNHLNSKTSNYSDYQQSAFLLEDTIPEPKRLDLNKMRQSGLTVRLRPASALVIDEIMANSSLQFRADVIDLMLKVYLRYGKQYELEMLAEEDLIDLNDSNRK